MTVRFSLQKKQPLDQIFNDVLRNFVSGQSLSRSGDVISDVIRLVRIVEEYRFLEGEDKKQLVLRVVQHWVQQVADENDPDESETKILLENILDSVVPFIIDAAVDVDKNGIRLKKKWKNWFRMSCCRRA